MALSFSLETVQGRNVTTSIWQNTSVPALASKVDVVIVGAGITGLSVAYWLKELRPKLKITIVDGVDVGAGASGKNAGFVTAGSLAYLAGLIRREGKESALSYWEEKQKNLSLMKEKLLGENSDFLEIPIGSTTLYRNEKTLKEDYELLCDLPAMSLSDSIELSKEGLFDFFGGLKLISDRSVNPLKLLKSMRSHLDSLGVEFLMGNSLAWIENDGKVILEKGEIQAEKIFVCVNGYAGQVSLALNEWVKPKRAQIISIQTQNFNAKGNFYDPDNRVYFRKHHLDTLLVGGMRLIDEKAEDSDFDKVSKKIQLALEKYGQDLIRSKPKVIARWSGIMGFTQDEKPLIKVIPGTHNAIFIGGYSGHGMGMAFGLAQKAVKQFFV